MPRPRITSHREDAHFRVLDLVRRHPALSQRQMAIELGISLGWMNFCLRELAGRGLIKIENFRNASDKARYLHVLTPDGVAERAHLAARFLKRKRAEYEALRVEIEALNAQLAEDGGTVHEGPQAG